MNSEDLYDDFGNYIGPENSTRDNNMDYENEGLNEPEEDMLDNNGPIIPELAVVNTMRQLSQLELYRQPYDQSVETIVMEEDTQTLNEPIVAPLKSRLVRIEERPDELPFTTYKKEFLVDLLNDVPSRVKTIAIVGQLGSGKTSLVDLLLQYSHPIIESLKTQKDKDEGLPLKYTDTLVLERKRGISLQPIPATFLASTSNHTSLAIQMIDCPGHLECLDQLLSAISLADGIVLVVDALEGVMCGTEAVFSFAKQHNMPITVVINKIDRLFLELKLPPQDAYFKLKHTIDAINTQWKTANSRFSQISPELGNLLFADTQSGYIFSIDSFSRLYGEFYDLDADFIAELSKRLWGEVFFDPKSGQFLTSASGRQLKRTFVEFILEPLYKVYGQVIAEDPPRLKETLSSLGIHLKESEYKWNVKPLLKLVMGKFFGPDRGLTSFVDMVSHFVPNPLQNSPIKVAHFYTGNQDSSDPIFKLLTNPTTSGPLYLHVTKMYACNSFSNEDNPQAEIQFEALARIYSGSLSVGQKVTVLGEAFSPQDPEDSSCQTILSISIPVARYSIPVNSSGPGTLVLLRGVDNTITKTATITSYPLDPSIYSFKPLQTPSLPIVKLALEPFRPSELPKLLTGLRYLMKTYPHLQTHVEASGEHCLLSTGELNLDSILYDLRHTYAPELDLRVADPVTCFNETIVEMSELPCFATSPNGKNTLTMIAQPLESPLAQDIESGHLLFMSEKDRSNFIVEKYEKFDWDLLAARNIWAFGPERTLTSSSYGTCILQNDTLSFETPKALLNSSRDAIVQGFQWAVKEGPLCDEPIRNVRFRLTTANLAAEPLYRGNGQIIPTSRRVIYSSFLTGAPRLMEPVYSVHVQCTAEALSAAHNIFAKRRGHVLQEIPKEGTPLYSLKGLLPVMDSFGFETDLRTHTYGKAFSQAVLDHWQIVPGDPLDTSITLIPLEPAPAPHLARDFLLKTRRRKGLPDDPSLVKFLDDAMRTALEAHQEKTKDL